MPHKPIATYRLQLRPEFGFAQVTQIIPYLKDLGISHIYTSPYFQAAKGSTHGYDVVDPTKINEELGGSQAHEEMCQAINKASLQHMIDIVPNHMVVSAKQNPWWWDVLENGPSSQYATFFDIDWEVADDRWPNKVLLPVLGDHYGRVLENNELQLAFAEGHFVLNYHDKTYPIDPSSLSKFLSRAADLCQSDTLAFIAENYARLPQPTVKARQQVSQRQRDKMILSHQLNALYENEVTVLKAINDEIERINRDPDSLDELIALQNYRLAFWRTASRDLSYRRFFDVNDLAGIRVEDSTVFLKTHQQIIKLVQEKKVQGLRVDHPDGLQNPSGYFKALREACPSAWIVAEKILEEGEETPVEWPIEGTTGYDFLNVLGGIFIDPKGKDPLTKIYTDFIGEPADYNKIAIQCKRLAVKELLGSELNHLTNLLVAVCERHRRYRDYTYRQLQDALCEVVVAFPVYRTYLDDPKTPPSTQDERNILQAVEIAKKVANELDPELFDFLKNILLLRVPGTVERELVMRFQQLTGPAMAKGIEDTAFYRYLRLISLNEVGGNPNSFGITKEVFHLFCQSGQQKHPFTLLTSTTHDTKRGEDVRYRLAVLSEIPEKWETCVKEWYHHNTVHRHTNLIDKNTEYLFYQTLVGAWPIDETRMLAYLEKAVREAKVYSSWNSPNTTYETGAKGFVSATFNDQIFMGKVAEFVTSIANAGYTNSLSALLIKLTAPGVPDIYQGTELWNFSLVDPDNRRLVDFESRKSFLASLNKMTPQQMIEQMHTGHAKLWITKQVLNLKQQKKDLFNAVYTPLKVNGCKHDHVISFSLGQSVVIVAPRLPVGLDGNWEDTQLKLPAGSFCNALTQENSFQGSVFVKDLLQNFPVALLIQDTL